LARDDPPGVDQVLCHVHDVSAGAAFVCEELLLELAVDPLAHVEHAVNAALVSQTGLGCRGKHALAGVARVLVGSDVTVDHAIRARLCIMDRDEARLATGDGTCALR
jgi:hypothetical protein